MTSRPMRCCAWPSRVRTALLALYSITRGNKRAYLHAELLAANAALGEVLPTPATLQRQLKSTGELRLPKQVEPSAAWAELLARSLRLDSTLRVSISGAQAEAWREALVAQRVRASRLELGEAMMSLVCSLTCCARSAAAVTLESLDYSGSVPCGRAFFVAQGAA